MGAYGLDSVIGRELGGSHLSGIDSLLAEHQPPVMASIFKLLARQWCVPFPLLSSLRWKATKGLSAEGLSDRGARA